MSSQTLRCILFARLLTLCSLASAPLLAAVTIVPVPVNPNANSPYISAGAYKIRVEDAANSANFADVDVHVHKVAYPTTAGGSDVVHTNVYYGHFSFGGGAVKVKVTLGNFQDTVPLNSYTPTLSPTSSGITVTKDTTKHNLISFPLSSPRYFILNIADSANSYPCKLLIFADALEVGQPSSPSVNGTGGIYDVTKTPYFADVNNAADCRTAFNNAITAASGYSGGGTVFVPPGIYRIDGPLTAKSNVKVYLAPGAYIRTHDNLSRATLGSKMYAFDATSANAVTNFKIFGRGTIDCNGIAAGGHHCAKGSFGNPDNADNIETYGVLSMALRADNATNITVDGIVLRESCGWTVHPDRSTNVVITNTKVVNYMQDFEKYREDDGIDLVQCQNSKVTHCLVYCADDAVCIKGGDGFDTIFPGADNCIYYDLVLHSGAFGLKFGMQADAPISNSFFKNCDIVQAKNGIGIIITRGDSLYNNIGFTDVRCESVVTRPLDFYLVHSGMTADVTNVKITNFSSVSGASLCRMQGQSADTINGVAFTNLKINATPVNSGNAGSYVFVGSNVTNVTYASTTIDPNLVQDVSPTGMGGTWKTTGNTLALINDHDYNNEGQTSTQSADAYVIYPVPNMILSGAKIWKDNGTSGAASWTLERQDVVTGTWSTVFASASCTTDGGNDAPAFTPTLASAVRITFHPVTNAYVGINEVEIYGR